jgi:transposase
MYSGILSSLGIVRLCYPSAETLLLLVTNVTDLTPPQILERYKSLADIERGFRVLKSEIEIGPVYHRLPERIRAQAMICFIALVLYRVLCTRLKDQNTGLSPERALSVLRRIQHHQAKLPDDKTIEGLSSITPEKTAIFSAMGVAKPDKNRQLTRISHRGERSSST